MDAQEATRITRNTVDEMRNLCKPTVQYIRNMLSGPSKFESVGHGRYFLTISTLMCLDKCTPLGTIRTAVSADFSVRHQ